MHGLDGHWNPIKGAGAFDPDRWLRTGREWDDESIGLLAHPPPPVAVLESDMVRLWAQLGDLDADDALFAAARDNDRAAVVAAIAGRPTSVLSTDMLWQR